jgi:methionine sulfoxide reductase heme-binding subunit
MRESKAQHLAWQITLAHAVAALPLIYLTLRAFSAQLGVNPVQALTHATGWWALVFLMLSQAMTPLRKLSKLPIWLRMRRMLGLWSFAFACLHVGVFVVWDLQGELLRLAIEVRERPYISAGLLAWMCLLPLALTSTQSMQRRLGRAWRTLHRLSYVAGFAAVLHFYWQSKADDREAFVFAAVFALLMLARMRFAQLFARARSQDL